MRGTHRNQTPFRLDGINETACEEGDGGGRMRLVHILLRGLAVGVTQAGLFLVHAK